MKLSKKLAVTLTEQWQGYVPAGLMSSKAAKSNNSRLIVQRDYSLVINTPTQAAVEVGELLGELLTPLHR